MRYLLMLGLVLLVACGQTSDSAPSLSENHMAFPELTEYFEGVVPGEWRIDQTPTPEDPNAYRALTVAYNHRQTELNGWEYAILEILGGRKNPIAKIRVLEYVPEQPNSNASARIKSIAWKQTPENSECQIHMSFNGEEKAFISDAEFREWPEYAGLFIKNPQMLLAHFRDADSITVSVQSCGILPTKLDGFQFSGLRKGNVR